MTNVIVLMKDGRKMRFPEEHLDLDYDDSKPRVFPSSKYAGNINPHYINPDFVSMIYEEATRKNYLQVVFRSIVSWFARLLPLRKVDVFMTCCEQGETRAVLGLMKSLVIDSNAAETLKDIVRGGRDACLDYGVSKTKARAIAKIMEEHGASIEVRRHRKIKRS